METNRIKVLVTLLSDAKSAIENLAPGPIDTFPFAWSVAQDITRERASLVDIVEARYHEEVARSKAPDGKARERRQEIVRQKLATAIVLVSAPWRDTDTEAIDEAERLLADSIQALRLEIDLRKSGR